MTALDEMWTELARYQPFANLHGFGVEWRTMCAERTEDAALAARWSAYRAAAASIAGEAAWTATSAAGWAADSMERARRAVESIRTAIEQEKA